MPWDDASANINVFIAKKIIYIQYTVMANDITCIIKHKRKGTTFEMYCVHVEKIINSIIQALTAKKTSFSKAKMDRCGDGSLPQMNCTEGAAVAVIRVYKNK